ncbi:hypothetical protein [Ammoniphilus sp. 3BR4]|uniref:hypothetical protein n=1 Tax=Ammoniphilus sp. 3BR4 TaxID=3158265 RepID=UPI003466ADA1
MWTIAGILAIGVIIVLIEVPSLLKKNHRKDLWVFSILFLFGVALNILDKMDVPIPNPFKGITAIFHPYGEMISQLFK